MFSLVQKKKKVFERIKAILSYQTYVDSCKFPSLELILDFQEFSETEEMPNVPIWNEIQAKDHHKKGCSTFEVAVVFTFQAKGTVFNRWVRSSFTFSFINLCLRITRQLLPEASFTRIRYSSEMCKSNKSCSGLQKKT